MSWYRKGTKFTREDGRLTIFQKDKKYNTDNWYCRFFIEKKQVEKSSKTKVKKDAIKRLTEIFNEYHFLKKRGEIVHSLNLKDAWNRFELDLDKGNFKSSKVTSTGIRNDGVRFKKYMGNLKVDRIGYDDIRDFLSEMQSISKKDKLRKSTLKGYISNFSIFDTWCVDNDLKKKKLSNIQKNIFGNFKEDTSRDYFDREEYQKLLSVSKARIDRAVAGGLDGGKKVAFSRKVLHQFIIFGVNTGIRVGGILNLRWRDVQLCDRKTDSIKKGIEKDYSKDFFSQLDRYYTINNVRDKTSTQRGRENIGLGGSYYAIENMKKINNEYNIDYNENDRIFNVKSFAVGFNSLLEEAKLKFRLVGNEKLRRDAVSLRHTYIIFMLENNYTEFDIATNVGTSANMIHQNYTKNIKIRHLVDKFGDVKDRQKIRLVSIR